ncbi:hypothetical protein [Caldisalinibacter kiritimatiensis]|uniref:Uncharacterized protein n=1 Tax=Caldisalinibacter kiritimatiensis TaxID=1304284 RepID=R1CXU1_9FIRM|nr:hypothetical protein [Caldisalinibacter kiritimatiensis]EOD01419.1 hypothetical protein L21TH_0466 [Caldisalinibacter kiritimatiensis]
MQAIRMLIETTKMRKVRMDQKGGPGLEEAALLLFIGLVVFSGADGLGNAISTVFTNVTSEITSTFGTN